MFVYRLRLWTARWILAGGLRRVVATAVAVLPAVLGFLAISGSLLYGLFATAVLVLLVGLVATASAPRARRREGLTTGQRRAATSAILLGTSTDDPAVAAAILKRLDRRDRSASSLNNSAVSGVLVTSCWAWFGYKHLQHHQLPSAFVALLLAIAGIVQLATLSARRRAQTKQARLTRQSVQTVLAAYR